MTTTEQHREQTRQTGPPVIDVTGDEPVIEIVDRGNKSALAGARSHGDRNGSALGEGNIGGRIAALGRLHPLQGRRLLDIGCGNGAYTQRLAEGFDRTDAVDLWPEPLADFADRGPGPDVHLHVMSADDLSFADGSFDLVTAVEVMEHVADPAAVAREAHRVLRPGGSFLITSPNKWFPVEQHGFVLRGRRHSGWKAPFLTWVPPAHRRVSNSRVWTTRSRDAAVRPAGFDRRGVTWMMPPFDQSARARRWLGPAARAADRGPTRRMGQTLVARYVADGRGSGPAA